ncbi:MAG: hypothetical protein O7E51_08735 [Acidobacteria bacterium]|nr:hypothetical protein [Acidobacteriota bacterium]
MKRSYFIIALILIVLGTPLWINFMESKSETSFASDGIQIQVLEAEVTGELIRIVEPNGEVSFFSDQTKRAELMRIADRQQSLMGKADYFYHRLERYIKRKLDL